MDDVLYKKVVKNGSSLAINIPVKEVQKQNSRQAAECCSIFQGIYGKRI